MHGSADVRVETDAPAGWAPGSDVTVIGGQVHITRRADRRRPLRSAGPRIAGDQRTAACPLDGNEATHCVSIGLRYRPQYGTSSAGSRTA
jgi:hypothetical protein